MSAPPRAPSRPGLPPRSARGLHSSVRVRGVVEEYLCAEEAGPSSVYDSLRIVVTETDSRVTAVGDVVFVTMPEPLDANLGVRDLATGFSRGDIDPVPEGSEVTFLHCFRLEDGTVEAMSYDVASIVRPPPSPAP